MFPHKLHATKTDAEIGADQVTYAIAMSHLAPPKGAAALTKRSAGGICPQTGT